ncbi:MAG: DegT/DnrJ/EryC1/StrS family aminotransferase [Pseudomonadota bacterium]
MSEMKVPFIDLKERFVEERDELMARIEETLAKGHLVLTPELNEFEEMVQDYTGAKHCVGLNSGTDALMMGLWASGIGPGDEVIHPPISFVATTGAIVHVGATPVFADVRDDQLIDPEDIERKITPKTKVIMPVHWTGKMCDMDAITDIAERHNLIILEDSAQSMGSTYKGKHGGLFGPSGAISCHPLKNLNALGDGGLLLTDDDEIARKIRLYRNHGLESRDNVVMYGVNSRLDVLSAVVMKYRLERLDEVIARRKRNADLYRELITAPDVFIPEEREAEGYKDSYVMFLIQADRRDELQAFLRERGVETLIYYGTPLHLHRAAEPFGYKRGDLPVAERQCEKVLALPHNQQISEDQVAYVSAQVNAFYGA